MSLLRVSSSTLPMDPVSIVALVGTSAKILDICLRTGCTISDIGRRWRNAPQLLKNIAGECDRVAAQIRLIKEWLEERPSYPALEDYFLGAMSATLGYCLERLQELESAVDKIRPRHRDDLGRWERLKLSISDSALRACQSELRWQVLAASQLYSSFQLQVTTRLAHGGCPSC